MFSIAFLCIAARPDLLKTAIWQGGKSLRKGCEYRLAGVPPAQSHFDGRACVSDIVLAQNQLANFRPVVGREL